MRCLPFLLLVLSSVFQALLTWAWVKLGMADRFMAMIQAFYGAEASWSAFAFSLGWLWLAAPAAGLAYLALALGRKGLSSRAWSVCGVSVSVSLSMLYAMYPLHLIFG